MTLSRSCLAVSHRLIIHLCAGARMWLEVGETDDIMVDAIIKSHNVVEAVFKKPGCGWR